VHFFNALGVASNSGASRTSRAVHLELLAERVPTLLTMGIRHFRLAKSIRWFMPAAQRRELMRAESFLEHLANLALPVVTRGLYAVLLMHILPVDEVLALLAAEFDRRRTSPE
jgi:hypothetical protein